MTMTDGTPDREEDGGALLKVLTAHLNALVSARSDEAVIRQYSALLRFLKSRPADFLEHFAHVKHRTDQPPISTGMSDEDIQKASLDDLEKLVNDEATPRRDMERIAIQRFSVPSGSMRRFSNRESLVEKLRSLIDNERAHETIRAVARREAKPTQDE
ncbi:MAG: hypothetical protein LAP87_15035 [Acidobacteriia bacterium]|nr:hypothetical protein [Terriglobia bacterium]